MSIKVRKKNEKRENNINKRERKERKDLKIQRTIHFSLFFNDNSSGGIGGEDLLILILQQNELLFDYLSLGSERSIFPLQKLFLLRFHLDFRLKESDLLLLLLVCDAVCRRALNRVRLKRLL